MTNSIKARVERMRSALSGATAFLRTRGMRRIGVIVAVLVLLFGIGGFFGLPMLLRHILTTQVAASLNRPVTVGDIAFNPYRLRLDLDQLHIADRDRSKPFVDIGHLRLKISWTSLFRLAPVVKELSIDRPAIHIVRTAEQQFNFSDLLVAKPPNPPPSKPPRFALSNIRLHDGDVRFDDQVLGEQHAIEHMQIDLPFIANLPADTEIFVQPLLRMVVDGSPVKIGGRARPFANQPESSVVLSIDHFNLAPYIGYVPEKLPIKIPHGALSAFLRVHFVQSAAGPVIRVSGQASLDDLEVRDSANAPLAGFKRATTTLDDLEPLNSVFHLGAITVDGLNLELVRKRDGTTNLTPLMAPQASAAGARAPASSPNQAAPAPSPAASPMAANSLAAPAASAANASASADASPTVTSSPTPAAISAPSIAASAPNAAPAATPLSSAEKSPLDLTMESVTLTNSTIKLTDNSLATPATVALQNINVGLKQFALGAKASPSSYDFAGNLSGGGSIAVKGKLDLVQSQVTSEITIDQVDLPTLQAYAQSTLAATFGTGKLNAHASVKTSFAPNKFNLHVEPASFSVDNLELRAPGGQEKPVQWSRFGATIAQVDLASHQAVVKEVHADGIRLSVKRGRHGKLSLLSLLRTQAGPAPERHERAQPRRRTGQARMTVTRGRRAATRRPRGVANQPAPATAAQPAAPEWQYRVESIAIENAEIDAEDDMASRPVKAAVAPLNLHLKNFTSDFHQPFDLEIDGVLNRRGNFKLNGPVVIAPLKATLHVNTRRLDLAFADPYATKDLNATIKSGVLTTNGVASAATVRDKLHISYRGDATIGNVRMLDKLTGDEFVRWNSLSFDRIDFGLGEGQPQVHVGAIALSDFYARLILNSNGRMNLSDITSNPAQAPKSLTREQTGQAAPASTPPEAPPPAQAPTPPSPSAPTASTATATANPAAQATPVPKPIGADIEFGRITLHRGHIDYSDFFIKPNYRANLTNISGKVGAFGTRSTTPADVLVEGQINGSAPINISGSINPLAPLAAVDIKAKADGIELTDLTAYSVKYTGYPITKGTLTVDVHYLLANQTLTATNHIFLDQLTFGDKVESPTAMNLPMRLAVAILKDSKGRINLDVPVSGSLNDPQFSLGGIILHAFMNILSKAVTAPFRLLASAIGGIAGGSSEDLSYVEFTRGRATLTADSRKRLDTVADALKARTALKLSISGRIDPETDKPGLREAKVDDLVTARMIDSEGASDTASDQIPPDLYNKYLKKVYKAAKFEKPRDMIGLDKSLPPDEMKKLLVANMEVSDGDLKNLADARAQAVRQYLSTKIDPARLFTAAPKLDASGIDDKGKTTRAELALQ